MALHLAACEGLPAASLEVVELAALLHDANDWKYAKGTRPAAADIQEFLEGCRAPPELARQVLSVVAGVGFKDELGAAPGARVPAELAVVQDADRLDALGALGVARCFTFGGRFARPLHNPAAAPRRDLTRAAYTDARVEQTTINHFHEKLLRLEGMMKTASGRRLAQQRTAYMREFLDRFDAEWHGRL